MSRPTKYTLETIEEVCKWIRAGNSKEDAAVLAGISGATLFDWQNKHAEFLEAVKEAEVHCKAARIARILKASETTWQAAAWFLERKYKDEFATKKISETDLTSKGEKLEGIVVRFAGETGNNLPAGVQENL